MTLDEAIKHVEEIAEENEYNAQICHKILKDRLADFRDLQAENNFIKCAEEHRQIAEWLKELKRSEKFKQKAEVVISQLRADRDRLEDVIEKMKAEIKQVKSIMNEEIINHDRKDLINFVNGLNQSLAIIDTHTKEREATE